MGPARIAVLVIAAIAAIAAVFLMRSMTGGSDNAIVAQAPEPVATIPVLTAARDLAPGERIAAADLAWTDWPEAAAGPSFVTQVSQPDAMEAYADAVVRDAIAANEPVLPGKVVLAGEGGFLSASLSPGMRAASIPISVESGAGGFILPYDRVDVLLTRETVAAQDGGPTAYTTDTVLSNVRVLAIDQASEGPDSQQVLVGSTATLEVTPSEAEMLAQAQAMGTIRLTLRSLADSVINEDEQRAAGLGQAPAQASIQVYRYGGASQVAVQDTEARAR
jgi:pilus assembly protein CpaB